MADGTATTLRKQAQGKEIFKVAIEDGDRNEIYLALRTIDTIEMIDPFPNYTNAYEIQSRANETSRRAVFKLCVEKGWVITEMTPVERKLEEVFRDLTLN